MREELDRQLSEKLANATAAWKDQKLLDIETTEAIVNRLQSWAKLFGFFVALPLMLILIWLGLLGFKSYTDVDKQLKEATGNVESLEKRTTGELQTAEQKVGSLTQKEGDITSSQEKISREQRDIGPRLSSVSGQVSALQDRATKLSKNMDEADQLVARVNQLSGRLEAVVASQQAQQAVDIRRDYEKLSSDLKGSDQAKAAAATAALRRVLIAAGYSPDASADGPALLAQLRLAMGDARTDNEKLDKLFKAFAATM
jgi:myosin heavy subunit